MLWSNPLTAEFASSSCCLNLWVFPNGGFLFNRHPQDELRERLGAEEGGDVLLHGRLIGRSRSSLWLCGFRTSHFRAPCASLRLQKERRAGRRTITSALFVTSSSFSSSAFLRRRRRRGDGGGAGPRVFDILLARERVPRRCGSACFVWQFECRPRDAGKGCGSSTNSQ